MIPVNSQNRQRIGLLKIALNRGEETAFSTEYVEYLLEKPKLLERKVEKDRLLDIDGQNLHLDSLHGKTHFDMQIGMAWIYKYNIPIEGVINRLTFYLS